MFAEEALATGPVHGEPNDGTRREDGYHQAQREKEKEARSQAGTAGLAEERGEGVFSVRGEGVDHVNRGKWRGLRIDVRGTAVCQRPNALARI